MAFGGFMSSISVGSHLGGHVEIYMGEMCDDRLLAAVANTVTVLVAERSR